MTLFMGFYLLPEWGIKKSVILTASLLGAIPVMLFFVYRKYKFWVAADAVLLVFLFASASKPVKDPKSDVHFLYRSEGILGQVSVLDNPHPDTKRLFRLLFINQIPQTQVNVALMPASGWLYPHRLATLASIKPRGSRALLIGMGGGSIAMELKKILSSDALLLINFQGYFQGKHGKAARSICRTLQESGFRVKYFCPGTENEDADVHIFASLTEQNFDSINEDRLNACCKVMPHQHNDLITDTEADLSDAIILTDEKPRLETLNSYANEQWRERTIETYLINLRAKKIPYFR